MGVRNDETQQEPLTQEPPAGKEPGTAERRRRALVCKTFSPARGIIYIYEFLSLLNFLFLVLNTFLIVVGPQSTRPSDAL